MYWPGGQHASSDPEIIDSLYFNSVFLTVDSFGGFFLRCHHLSQLLTQRLVIENILVEFTIFNKLR